MFSNFREESLKFLFDWGLNVHIRGGCISVGSNVTPGPNASSDLCCDNLLVFEKIQDIPFMSKTELLKIYGGSKLESEIIRDWEMMKGGNILKDTSTANQKALTERVPYNRMELKWNVYTV